MAKINLLPTELGENASVLKIAELSKRFTIVIFSIIFILGTLAVGYIVFLNTEIKSSQIRQDSLKSSISSYGSSEQSLYLLKDRIGKIKTLLSAQSANSDIAAASTLLANSPNISLTHVDITSGKTTISATSKSSGDAALFFTKVLGATDYKSINLTTFSFNPASGYIFDLTLNTK